MVSPEAYGSLPALPKCPGLLDPEPPAPPAMVIVISSSLGGYQNMTTVDMTTSFMTAAYETDIIAKGEIVKAGKRMIFGQIRLYGVKSDTPVANVWTTWMLL